MPGEHSYYTHDPVLKDERVAGKRSYVLSLGPVVIADSGIVLHIIRQMRLSFPGNQSDLHMADRNPAVAAIELRVYPRARLQLQLAAFVLQGPNAGEGSIQMPDQCIGAFIQNPPQI